MDLLEIMRKRRSIRSYTQEQIPEESLMKILQAGLLSESGKAKRPWKFIVVRDKETLAYLSGCRAGGVKMLKEAQCAIVVIGDAKEQDGGLLRGNGPHASDGIQPGDRQLLDPGKA